METLANHSNGFRNESSTSVWMLEPGLNNIALGIFWALVTMATLVVNMFICLYTVVYMTKKKSSNIPTFNYSSQSSLLLFNLALSFVIQSVFALPFVTIAVAMGEWMTWKTGEGAKIITCSFSGFILTFSYTVGIHTLAVISIERFLFVSKPHIHKHRFTNKVVLIIILVIWIYCFFLASTPFFNFGGYTFYKNGGICIPPIADKNNRWLIIYILFSTFPIVTIIVMIVATFAFARHFARQMESSRQRVQIEAIIASTHVDLKSSRSSQQQKSFSSAVRNSVVIIDYRNETNDSKRINCCCSCGKKSFTLYGVFVAMVILYGIQLLTGSVSAVITISTGPDFQPVQLQAASTYLAVALPAITGIIQVYFRPEFRQAVCWIVCCILCLRKSRRPWESNVPNLKSQLSRESNNADDCEGEDSPVTIVKATSKNDVIKCIAEDCKHCNKGNSPCRVALVTKYNIDINDTTERLEDVTHGYHGYSNHGYHGYSNHGYHGYSNHGYFGQLVGTYPPKKYFGRGDSEATITCPEREVEEKEKRRENKTITRSTGNVLEESRTNEAARDFSWSGVYMQNACTKVHTL